MNSMGIGCSTHWCSVTHFGLPMSAPGRTRWVTSAALLVQEATWSQHTFLVNRYICRNMVWIVLWQDLQVLVSPHLYPFSLCFFFTQMEVPLCTFLTCSLNVQKDIRVTCVLGRSPMLVLLVRHPCTCMGLLCGMPCSKTCWSLQQ